MCAVVLATIGGLSFLIVSEDHPSNAFRVEFTAQPPGFSGIGNLHGLGGELTLA